jgi:aldehyde:ferredoxin oxidoreductase
MSPAYAEKLLRIDLRNGNITTETIPPDETQRWLMGSGLAARLFYQSMDRALDPLDPASPLLVFNGLLTGTIAPAAARSSWCGRSPLTGIWNEANVGGHWGSQLRAAGFAGMVLTGRAPSPVWLCIEDDHVQIRDARGVWGAGTFETQERLREQSAPQAEVASIGPAGENLVRIAGIMTGGQGRNRAAGRGGMGALMGSKNLKAIVVRGSARPDYPDPARARAAVREANDRIRQDAAAMSLSKLGTAGGVPGTEATGDLPLKNWREGSWPAGALATSGQAIHERMWDGDTRCFACPIGCGKEIRIDAGPYAGVWGEGPEYETLAGFGGNVLIDDLEAIAAINQLCNDLGLDTISSASVVGFATEAMERGLIEPEQANLRLAWGDPGPVLELLSQVAWRRGLGAQLADGVRAAAGRIGPGAEQFALHVKGLELPYHDPRGFVDMGLNYATASRGACHLEGLTYWRGYGLEWPGWQEGPYDRFTSDRAKVETVISFQDFLTTYNPLGLCKFIVKAKVGPAGTVQLVNALAGWQWSADDLLRAGERLFNLKRLINLRLGVTRADDTLPMRILKEPRPSGSAAGVLPDLSVMLPLYYRLRGWDAEGRPTRERLEALGLAEL